MEYYIIVICVIARSSIMQVPLDIDIHILDSTPFHLAFISTVLEMKLLFPAVDLPILHIVVVIILLRCSAGEKSSQVLLY